MAREFYVKLTSSVAGSGPFSIYYNSIGNYATRVSTGLAASAITYSDITTGDGVLVSVQDNYNAMIIVDEDGVCDATSTSVPAPPANASGCVGNVGLMAPNGGSYLPGAISTSGISISINSSVDLSGRNWCATCGVCYEYVIMVSSYYMGKTDLQNDKVMCLCTETLNYPALISYINLVAHKKGAGPFTLLSDAMDWARSQGLLITNQNYPYIPTFGQVLLLDAGLPSSYPMQGTSWYNMAANNNTGTLNGGITFSDTDIMDPYGNLHFDGVNDYVSFASTSNIPVGSSNYTINVWFSPDLSVNGGIVGWGNYSVNNQSNSLNITTTGLTNSWGTNKLEVEVVVTTELWHNVVATFDGTTRKLYFDGVLIGSDTPAGLNVSSASNLTIGRVDTSYYDGKLSLVQILTGATSAQEISNSYDSVITRYDGSCTQMCITPVFCNSPTPTPSSPTPTPTPTPPPTPELQGQCIEVTSNETGVIFLDYKRRDGVQACQPLGQGQTLPVCVYPGEGGNIESWDGFPCEGPNNLLPPSAISVAPMGLNCYNAGECITDTLNPIVLAWDESGYNSENGKQQFGCSLVSICVEANKT